MTKRVKYTAIWKEPIEIVEESRLSFFTLRFPPERYYSLLHNPPQSWFSASSTILLFSLLLHLLIYSIYFPSTNTLTSYRPYIDPTSTLDSTFFNTTSWIEKLYRTTTTFLLFSLLHHHHHHILLFSRHRHHHHHHISFVFPPPPAHYYFSLHHHHYHHVSIVFPPPHFFCFPATSTSLAITIFPFTTTTTILLLFSLHHHHLHITIVSLHHHHPHITIFPSTTTFLLFSSSSFPSTSSSSFLLFSLEKAKEAKIKPRRPHSNSNEKEDEVVEVDEEGKQ